MEIPDVFHHVYIPLLDSFGDAELVESGMLDEETAYLGYANGSEEDLDLFVCLCQLCGLYRYGGPKDDGSIGRSGANPDGLVSNVFSGPQETCWYELYAGVDYPKLHRYLSDMMLCGFDIRYDNVEFGDGTSRVAVSYDTESSSASVYYEPGVDRYLMKGAEYDRCIPQP